jgi:hypothetical protein
VPCDQGCDRRAAVSTTAFGVDRMVARTAGVSAAAASTPGNAREWRREENPPGASDEDAALHARQARSRLVDLHDFVVLHGQRVHVVEVGHRARGQRLVLALRISRIAVARRLRTMVEAWWSNR